MLASAATDGASPESTISWRGGFGQSHYQTAGAVDHAYVHYNSLGGVLRYEPDASRRFLAEVRSNNLRRAYNCCRLTRTSPSRFTRTRVPTDCIWGLRFRADAAY